MTGCESPRGLRNCCVKAALVGGKETKRFGGIFPPAWFPWCSQQQLQPRLASWGAPGLGRRGTGSTGWDALT